MIVMQTEPLDIDAIIREIDPATATYPRAPEGLRIGHVHLRVGDIAQAEKFYRDAVGLDVLRRRGGATFMSSGGYHHHVGANVWHSQGAGVRDPRRAGLDWFAIEAADQATMDALRSRLRSAGALWDEIPGGIAVKDPWGTKVRFVSP
jgi:catechol 2,3-dioxygenase